ncbi:MAG: SUMF1/EgtB/PvdO family nonheme iron enzyme [Trueperaceae bacterium]|nr:MAG: SUMF1/EgtB/PvdO family nonheme iron enzyme [Trueperaceae bacterium]
MTRERWIRFTRAGALLLAASLLLLVACARRGVNQPVELAIVEVVATSSTSLQVTFDKALGSGAENPNNYQLSGPDGSLAVLAAYVSEDGFGVTLGTAEQRAVSYQLSVRNIGVADQSGVAGELSASAVNGSTEKAPQVASAIAISNTEVLITFVDPNSAKPEAMGPGLDNPSYYEITPPLAVTAASPKEGGTMVLLETAPQEQTSYTVKVTNVLSKSGGKLVDPQHNTAGFLGKGRQGDDADEEEPSVLGAVALDSTTVLVNFSEPLRDSAADPSRYAIQNASGLAVIGATLNEFGTQATLTTPPQAVTSYTLTVSGVQDTAGNPIGAANTATFFGISDASPPSLAGAISLSNTEVLVTFSEAMETAGVANTSNYTISPVLNITGAEQQPGATMVLLTTAPQEQVNYTLIATNVKSAASKKLIDPTGNSATFSGIPVDDGSPPEILSAVATSTTSVQVNFSEPLRDNAADATLYDITDAAGNLLPVTDAVLNAFNTQATLTTLSQVAGESYTLAVISVADKAGNPIDPSKSTTTFAGFTSIAGSPGDDLEPPKLATVVSTGNTSVVVSYSEPVRKADAETATNYRIYASRLTNGSLTTEATLNVTAASLGSDGTAVTLTTGSQSDIQYTIEVGNVRDIAGNQISPKDRLTGPANTGTFFGRPPSGKPADSDGDGLSDEEEQRGWIITISLANGDSERREVTSDPGDPSLPVDHQTNVDARDTDADGLPDNEEKNYLTNPRDADTDDDQLTDSEEWNFIYSDPTDQDTDGDGIADGFEYDFLRTSPIEADTDGDQILDGDEVKLQNRNPLISDLPLISIVIGDVSLTLDERYTFTDSRGQTVTEEEGTKKGEAVSASASTSVTLEQGISLTYGTSSSETLSAGTTETKKIDANYTFPSKKIGVSGEYSTSSTESREYNTTVSAESSINANQAYNNSLERGSSLESSVETSQSRERTESVESVRTIEDASMRVTLDLANLGDTAFSVSNLEITALQQDPFGGTTPVASMVPESALEGGSAPVFSLGPSVPKIGPLIFQNRSVFPSTVEDLLKNPRGLQFRVANYDITFEDGRNFAFASQDANDRTASFTIDYGDGRVDLYRVAVGTGRIAPFADTNGDGVLDGTCNPPGGDSCDNNGDGDVNDGDRIIFDGNGEPVGTTMREVLTSLLEIDYQTKKDQPQAVNTTVDTLFRIEDVSNDVPEHKAWILFSSRTLDETTDFDDILVRAGENYTLAFLQDKDQDGLFAREEYLYGSCDGATESDPGFCSDVANTQDTDADTIGDFDEIRTPVLIRLVDERQYPAFSDPRRVDSDDDGLSDFEERTGCLDDDDDFSCDSGDRFGPTDPRKRDTDQDGITDFDEVHGYAILFPGDADFTELEPGDDLPDGRTNPLKSEPFVTDPLNRDSDGDSLSDGFEVKFGTDPRTDDADKFLDTDKDGLSDFEERVGFSAVVNGVPVQMTSSQFVADSDGDGLPDLLEHIIGSNPRLADTDGDGLPDFDEFDPDYPNTFPAEKLAEFELRCEAAENCARIFDLDEFRADSPNYGSSLTDAHPFERVFNGITMVLVPPGSFRMGTGPPLGSEYEHPTSTQTFEEPFWIDQTEVTRVAYQACAVAGVCTAKSSNTFSSQPNQPINVVTWYQAAAYCDWRGGRLPTEAEWEYAARGPENRTYPWGEALPDSSLANYNVGQTTVVGSYPAGASWVGALDMAGNVTEWTRSRYAAYPYDKDDGREIVGVPSSVSGYMVQRGDNFYLTAYLLRSAFRSWNRPDYGLNHYGFRCARSSSDF